MLSPHGLCHATPHALLQERAAVSWDCTRSTLARPRPAPRDTYRKRKLVVPAAHILGRSDPAQPSARPAVLLFPSGPCFAPETSGTKTGALGGTGGQCREAPRGSVAFMSGYNISDQTHSPPGVARSRHVRMDADMLLSRGHQVLLCPCHKMAQCGRFAREPE